MGLRLDDERSLDVPPTTKRVCKPRPDLCHSDTRKYGSAWPLADPSNARKNSPKCSRTSARATLRRYLAVNRLNRNDRQSIGKATPVNLGVVRAVTLSAPRRMRVCMAWHADLRECEPRFCPMLAGVSICSPMGVKAPRVGLARKVHLRNSRRSS